MPLNFWCCPRMRHTCMCETLLDSFDTNDKLEATGSVTYPFLHKNLLARLMRPPPPDPPPWDFMYMLRAIFAALLIADCLSVPGATWPWLDCWSKSLLASLIAIPTNWFCEPWPPPAPPMPPPPPPPPENILSACIAAPAPSVSDVWLC